MGRMNKGNFTLQSLLRMKLITIEGIALHFDKHSNHL